MNKYYILFILFSLIITGCGSIYTANRFSSTKEFYADFNKSAANKSVTVTLISDSVITNDDGAMVINNTLILPGHIREYKDLPLNKVVSIKYDQSSYNPQYKASIQLKNGEVYNGLNVRITPGSFVEFTMLKDIRIPMNKIRKISYKNRWLGSLIGVPSGAVAGAGLGLFAASGTPGFSSKNNEKAGYVAIYTWFGCLVAGIVLGAFIGYSYTYIF